MKTIAYSIRLLILQLFIAGITLFFLSFPHPALAQTCTVIDSGSMAFESLGDICQSPPNINKSCDKVVRLQDPAAINTGIFCCNQIGGLTCSATKGPLPFGAPQGTPQSYTWSCCTIPTPTPTPIPGRSAEKQQCNASGTAWVSVATNVCVVPNFDSLT